MVIDNVRLPDDIMAEHFTPNVMKLFTTVQLSSVAILQQLCSLSPSIMDIGLDKFDRSFHSSGSRSEVICVFGFEIQ